MRIANYKLEYEVRNQNEPNASSADAKREKKFVIIRNHQTVEVDGDGEEEEH